MNRRITKPPGGETNEIFTTPNSTPPSTPRKVKNYMASNIFNAEVQGGNGVHEPRMNIRHRPDDDSFGRLFGAQGNGNGDVTDSPRGKNHQKSNIIFADAGANGVTKNGTNGHHANGTGNHANGTNGTSNGHSAKNGSSLNGSNGHDHSESSSGSSTPNGNSSSANGGGGHGVNDLTPKTNGTNGTHDNASNGGTPTRRVPPGGFSSRLW